MQPTKKIISLKKNNIFLKAYSKGKCQASKTVALYALKKYGKDNKPWENGKSFLGITVSKARGNAVIRNRIKRKIKESYRSFYNSVKDGYNIVIVARSAAAESDFVSIHSDIYHCLKKADLLKEL